MIHSTNVRFINALILILFLVLGLTGLYGLVWPFPSSLFEIHRIAGWALIILIPWKSAIALRSLRRGIDRRLSRNVMLLVSILLTLATITILLLVLLWKWQIGDYYVWIGPYAYSGIGWHWGIALGMIPFFILHAWRRWPRPKQVDFSGRKQVLKLIGFGAAALVSWGAAESLANVIERNQAPRRFTGSREEGSFRGNAHPVTTAPGEGKIKLDPETWSLQVRGAVENPLRLTYANVLAFSISEVTSTLDCTGGWYTVQTWRGVRLMDLVSQAQTQPNAAGIILRGVADYTAPFTLAQAEEILLATYVSGEVLNHIHGFPLRAVVPSRRGWHWVKWMTEIEVISL
ncbi:MAG TPA: molybdopterin-dependent oxidoreductase [Anaerolineales bacterium]|nr:molybdopterin-dependent oxidoreductase [Anaerolineales bacterium]